MLRTSIVLLKPSREQERRLSQLAEASDTLWNIANYERRQTYLNYGKMPSYADQCRMLKKEEAFRRLGTCKAQALLSKLNEAWRSFYALLRLAKKGRLPPHIRYVSPPRYWKRDSKRTVKSIYVRNDSWWMDEEVISISRHLKIPYRCGGLWIGKQGRLEIRYDELSKKWYAHIPVEVEWRPPSGKSGKTAAVDLGICNLAALYIEGERPIIYSGRAVLSDWVYHTKKIALKQGRLPERKYTSKGLRKMFRRRQRRLRHAVNAMLRDLFDRLEAYGLGELVTGDLTGIRDSGSKGKNVNQKVNNFWVFNYMQKRIHELGEEYGIAVRQVSERDTSKTCCLCGKQHNGRIERGLMVCKETHRSINADVNGAVNIWKVAVNRFPQVLSTDKGETSGSGLMAQPLLLRWNYNEWR